MEYENMRVPELKALARDRELRTSRMRKAESVALLHKAGAKVLQNNDPLPGQSCASAFPTPHTRPSHPPPQRHAAYVTITFDDNGVAGFTAFLMEMGAILQHIKR